MDHHRVVTELLEALANGMRGMIQGIVIAAVTHAIFVVVARNGAVMQGTQFYRDSGYKNAYYLVVGL